MNSGNSTLGEPSSIDVQSVERALRNGNGQTAPGSSSSPKEAIARNACPECGRTVKWSEHSWCDNCGYFPSAGTRIEISDGFETEEIPPGEWYRLIPGWAWVTMGGVLLIVLASIGVRVALAESDSRATVALGFLGTGALLAFAAHTRAYFLAIQRNDKIGLFDIVMQPMEIWKPCTQKLPRTAMTVNTGSWGMTIALSGALVIGGINYSSALDLIAVEPAEEPPNALHKAVAGARKMAEEENGPKDLESAMNEFVGDEELTDEEGEGLAAAEDERPVLVCSVYGFTRTVDGELHSILLAGTLPDQERPRFVSKFEVDKIGDSESIATLSRVLPTIRVRRPYVPTRTRAYWVKPDLKCRVRYEDWSSRKGLVKPDFQELMIPDELQEEPSDDADLAQR
ncbi:hypothetical protein Mal4_53840 [Maioricimonas rarisocia]|uniref:DNA ligase (ATP) n=1 Tax=Maioricimonas rarisocia TaxID=2528026 RepID=A0A517ZF09_9PLAN|nr:hypothetical protein [Maioricimonas rarisocia]QDU41019.1 hypothetical protein Mal4_53840 [Maioricimonas rarisocia]